MSPIVVAFNSMLKGITPVILPIMCPAKGIASTLYCVPALVTSNVILVILMGIYLGKLGLDIGVPFSSYPLNFISSR